eukprot:GILJ01005890.1.p1 GENE.GILJ01005890.1~~GILJ01005890.1.p1  ORF type:complete len:360 (-),score=26.06 GILJ01005890.1:144-1223(-)
MDAEEAVVVHSGGNGALRLVLNRPKTLNALSYDTINQLTLHLQEAAMNSNVKLVLLESSSQRAFCAGGDIRALYEQGRTNYPQEFFGREFFLNHLTHVFPKPYISIQDGIVMGGGVGISVHGAYRVVTDKTVWSMPETGIGFIPDVGSSYFLSRLRGGLGLYLGLTGARLTGADCLYCGLATHLVPREFVDQLKMELCSAQLGSDAATVVSTVENILGRYNKPIGATCMLERSMEDIDRTFSKASSVEDVFQRLAASESVWAADTLKVLHARCPLSLKVTFRMLTAEPPTTLSCALQREFSVVCNFMHLQETNFYEGVRAVVVDKDQKPQWKPRRVQDVTDDLVSRFLATRPSSSLANL